MLEMRGPIGRWFTWDTRTPALCLVGGTGVVPAVSMLRTARRLGRTDLLRVVAVGRDPDELPYADELGRAGATLAYTRARHRRPARRRPDRRGAHAAARRASSSPTSAARPASRRTPRPAGRLRRRAGGDPGRAVRPDGRLRPAFRRRRTSRRKLAGPGVHDVSIRGRHQAVHPPGSNASVLPTVHREGRRETGNSGATSIRGEIVASLPSPFSAVKGARVTGRGGSGGQGLAGVPGVARPLVAGRAGWNDVTGP